ARLNQQLLRESSLDGEVELIGVAGLKMGVQLRSVARGGVRAHARKVGLREALRDRRQRRRHAIRAYAESGAGVDAAVAQALSCPARANAGDGLQQPGAEQRNQNKTHSIEPPINAAVAAA